MADKPVFIATPKIWMAQATAANTARDGTGTLVDVVTAGPSGSRIDFVDVKAIGTTTGGMVRLFVHDGTNTRLLDEVAISAVTPSGTVQAYKDALAFLGGLVLPTGWKLKAGTHNAESFNLIARGGDL